MLSVSIGTDEYKSYGLDLKNEVSQNAIRAVPEEILEVQHILEN